MFEVMEMECKACGLTERVDKRVLPNGEQVYLCPRCFIATSNAMNNGGHDVNKNTDWRPYVYGGSRSK